MGLCCGCLYASNQILCHGVFAYAQKAPHITQACSYLARKAMPDLTRLFLLKHFISMTYKHFPMDIDSSTAHMSTTSFLYHVVGDTQHLPKVFDSSYINFVITLPTYQRESFMKFYRNYLKRAEISTDGAEDFQTINDTPLLRSCFELAARYYFL